MPSYRKHMQRLTASERVSTKLLARSVRRSTVHMLLVARLAGLSALKEMLGARKTTCSGSEAASAALGGAPNLRIAIATRQMPASISGHAAFVLAPQQGDTSAHQIRHRVTGHLLTTSKRRSACAMP